MGQLWLSEFAQANDLWIDGHGALPWESVMQPMRLLWCSLVTSRVFVDQLNFRLELVTVPVSDIDRAKAFYVDQVGFTVEQEARVDETHRFLELLPPGSTCSIALTSGYIDAEPGSLQGVQLNVEDADAARSFLHARGVAVSDVQEYP